MSAEPPIELSQLFRRRDGPPAPHAEIGLVVGLVLRPSTLALVRWRSSPPRSTFEPPEALVETFQLP